MVTIEEPGFLTDREINGSSELFFKEKMDGSAEGASYDMRLGEEVYISGEEEPRLLSEKHPFVTVPRGQFALLLTKETVTMPANHFALISVKMNYKAKGLINVSGFHVDPGFEGKLVFSVYNAGPSDLLLKFDDKMFVIFFYRLHHHVDTPYSGNKLKQQHLPVEWVTTLKGTSASLSDVDKRVRSVETFSRILVGLVIALFGAIIAVAVVAGK